MYVKYTASLDKKNAQRVWTDDDPRVFDRLKDEKAYTKEVYFYPTEKDNPMWLGVIGHEKAQKTKCIENRVFSSYFVLHFCVGGKGYYNGQEVGRGDCFVCWPTTVHSLIADPDDPFEFYWLILKGEGTASFASKYGFKLSELIFKTSHIYELTSLFELGMNADYSSVNIRDFTEGYVKTVFSFHEKNAKKDLNSEKHISCFYQNYVDAAKQLLRDNNYALTVNTLASMLGITPKHFGRVFYQVTGTTPKDYITKKRLAMALELLNCGKSPGEAANILKYSDYTAFYRAFVRKYSITPSDYAMGRKNKNE